MMWTGVTRGLAGMKFSGSVNRLGARSAMIIRVNINTATPRRSFAE